MNIDIHERVFRIYVLCHSLAIEKYAIAIEKYAIARNINNYYDTEVIIFISTARRPSSEQSSSVRIRQNEST